MSDPINHRRGHAGIGAGLASVAAPPGAAHSNDDSELRHLWALYRKQRIIERAARAHFLEVDRSIEPQSRQPGHEAYVQWNAHFEEVLTTVRAIRAADASTLFGIGVKLVANEGEDEIEDSESAEAINDALRQLARLTGEAAFADAAAKFWAWDRTSGNEEDAA
jgi:hypothetical protein